MKKILFTTIRIISIILIIPPLLLTLPGVILHILLEETENKSAE